MMIVWVVQRNAKILLRASMQSTEKSEVRLSGSENVRRQGSRPSNECEYLPSSGYNLLNFLLLNMTQWHLKYEEIEDK